MLFDYIESKVFEMKPAAFMADFEGGIRSAVNKCYPNAALHGCWFHYKMAVRKKCGRDLHEVIANNPTAGTIYRMLLNLPLLPPNRITTAFEIIKKRAMKKKLYKHFADLFEYFNNFWLELVICI